MYKFDDNFLESVGLANIPAEQKDAFLQYAQDQLEARIGEKMSEGMTVDQLREFDGIMNNDRNTMIRVLSQIGDYRKDELYQKLLKRHNVTEGTLEILGEYLSVKWIQINRPDYATITANVAAELKNEIIEARPMILGVNA